MKESLLTKKIDLLRDRLKDAHVRGVISDKKYYDFTWYSLYQAGHDKRVGCFCEDDEKGIVITLCLKDNSLYIQSSGLESSGIRESYCLEVKKQHDSLTDNNSLTYFTTVKGTNDTDQLPCDISIVSYKGLIYSISFLFEIDGTPLDLTIESNSEIFDFPKGFYSVIRQMENENLPF